MEYEDALYSFINIENNNSKSSMNEFKSELVLNYSKNPLFEHLILHIKSYLKQNFSSKEKF